MKTCTKCKKELPLDYFAPRDNGRRLCSWCRNCSKEYKKNYWASIKDEMKEYKKKWYQENQERCKEQCRERYQNADKKHHAHVVWKNKLKRDFGINEETYFIMLEQQNNVCKICQKSDKRRLCVDHCHKTGRIRGLLCQRCNKCIGQFEDDPELLTRAIEYLK
jgi:ribosomal protein S20